MAQYKAIQDGEIQMYTDIENRLIDLATCKGIACEDTSVEESERAIEDALAERINQDFHAHDGRRTENSEILHSVRSS